MEVIPVHHKPLLLLLLPTRTYRAGDFLAAARRLDLEVVIGSDEPQALSDLSPLKSISLDFACAEQAMHKIVAWAGKHPIDAVVGVDDDTTILATLVAKALSLPHNSIEAAYATRDKHLLRTCLAAAGLPTPWFKLLSIDENPEDVVGSVNFPCVVKPLSLSASRGVIRANGPKQFVDTFHRVVSILQSSLQENGREGEENWLLVEGFVPGAEVALEGIMVRGNLKVLAIFDKPDSMDGPFFEETIYITPSRLSCPIQQEIVDCTTAAAKALGLREGPIHAELRVNSESVCVLEIAARSIGGLCSRTMRFSTGISLEELIILHAIQHEVNPIEREGRAAGVMMLPIPHLGILRAVNGQTEALTVKGIEEITITITIGQRVVPLPEGKSYLGFIFARALTPNRVEVALREAHHRIGILIEQ